MRKIILATNNAHKVAEMSRILDKYDILTLNDIGFNGDIVEDGYSFQDNAEIKARAVMEWVKTNTDLDCAVIADDSGLCVKALNYEPGIMSARYSGGGDEANRQKLLSNLRDIQDRTAYFQCYVVCLFPDGNQIVEEAKSYGLITKTKIGDESFGYDCIFWSNKLQKTFGQATNEEKDSVSHRGEAMRKIKAYLDSINYITSDQENNEEE